MTTRNKSSKLPLGSKKIPLYQKIYLLLEARAPNGENITETKIMEEFSVSRDTARKTLNRLEQDGLARRVKGRGTFLSARVEQVTSSVSILVNEIFFRSSGQGNLRAKFFELMDGILSAPHASSCRVQFFLLKNEASLEKKISDLKALGSSHGVILFSPTALEDLIQALRREQIPHMVLAPEGSHMNRVTDKSYDACFKAFDLAIGRGRKKMLFVSEDLKSSWTEVMLRAWKDAHTKNKLKVNESLNFEMGNLWKNSKELLLLKWKSFTEVDFVFTAEAESAIGLLDMASILPFPNREKIAMVSYEDHPRFTEQDSLVSAIRVPIQKMGESLLENIYEQIQFGFRDDVCIEFEDELVLRGTL